MLDRIARGEIPRKHHIVMRGPDDQIRFEHCLTRDGFDGPYTILYHEHEPHTQRFADLDHGYARPRPVDPRRLAKRHYKTQDMPPIGGAPVNARTVLIVNRDVEIGVITPDQEDPVYVVDGDADQLFFVHQGSGLLRTSMGDLRYETDDYICIPRGVIHRFVPDEGVPQKWLVIECHGLHLLKQWRNECGQLRMDAPYCHRDFRRPEFNGPVDEGLREMVVKRDGVFSGFVMDHSPLDTVGWDGTVYPWVFPILNFQPRAGLVHLPPTWHGTFGCRGGLICSFVPRAVDFHEEAIPCPYPHSSVDLDEFLYYVRGNFTSRRGVDAGSISHHPAGIPHGPHPGAYEGSIGHRETNELAVMLDTVAPMEATSAALAVEDANYQDSFIP